MTTIAFRDGTMAADSLLTESDKHNTIYIGEVDKIVRLGDGSLLGLSGDAEGQHIVNLLNDDTIPETDIAIALADVKSECDGLLVRPNGDMFWLTTNGKGWGEYTKFRDKFAAIGTGKQFAYGAMEAGADAEEAVRIACRRHAFTAPPIQVAKLNEGGDHGK